MITMKKHHMIMLVLFVLIVAIGVMFTLHKTGEKATFININVSDIKKVTAKTQVTDVVTDVIVPKEQWDELAKKLGSISIRRIDEEKKNGWEYFFIIEYEDHDTYISFMDDRVIIDDIVYEVGSYQPNEFLYLFE